MSHPWAQKTKKLKAMTIYRFAPVSTHHSILFTYHIKDWRVENSLHLVANDIIVVLENIEIITSARRSVTVLSRFGLGFMWVSYDTELLDLLEPV